MGLIVFIMGDFPDDLEEWWQLDHLLAGVLGGFHTKDGWMVLQVLECLNHEVQAVEDEALSKLFDVLSALIWILTQLNVLSGCDLPLLLDLLSADLVPHLMTVGKRVILPRLAEDVGLPNTRENEGLLELETLSLLVVW